MTVADDPLDRDTTDIRCDDWPVRPLEKFIGSREKRFQVVYSQSVLDDIHLHGQGSNDIEVCGVLVGNCYRDEHGPYLLIDHNIRGNGARTKATNVTFTAETWANIQEVMDRDHTDRKMVGWYHTHPGFGIFLSDMDLFICDNFFNIAWQVAFVYDPISGDEGNFIWRAGKTQRDAVLIEDDVTPAAAAIPLISATEPRSAGPEIYTGPTRTGSVESQLLELRIRVARLEHRQKLMIAGMVFLAAFVMMWALEFSQVAVPTPIKPSPTTKANR